MSVRRDRAAPPPLTEYREVGTGQCTGGVASNRQVKTAVIIIRDCPCTQFFLKTIKIILF